MSVEVQFTEVPSSDGIHTLKGVIYRPEGNARGLLHVVHGMTEHIGRYNAFMQKTAEAGYFTFGYDHLGHGKTARNQTELGYFAEKDGWKILAADVARFRTAMEKRFGASLPYYLLGHSMGSFVVRCSCALYRMPDKLIIMGTGGPHAATAPGIAFLKALKASHGGKYVSEQVRQMTFGNYNDRFAEEKDNNAWLTKDKAVREAYSHDPLCDFTFTVSAMEDLLHLNAFANSNRFFHAMAGKTPVLLVSGADDPVGNYGRGVEKVYQKLCRAGADARLKLYGNCRHEILNDTCRAEVTADILAFLDA